MEFGKVRMVLIHFCQEKLTQPVQHALHNKKSWNIWIIIDIWKTNSDDLDALFPLDLLVLVKLAQFVCLKCLFLITLKQICYFLDVIRWLYFVLKFRVSYLSKSMRQNFGWFSSKIWPDLNESSTLNNSVSTQTETLARCLIKIFKILGPKNQLQRVVFLFNQWINYTQILTADSSYPLN